MCEGSNITAARAVHYSPLRFLRRNQSALADHFRRDLAAGREKGAIERLGDPVRLHLANLAWDSAFFGTQTYLLRFVEWDDDLKDPIVSIAAAIEGTCEVPRPPISLAIIASPVARAGTCRGPCRPDAPRSR